MSRNEERCNEDYDIHEAHDWTSRKSGWDFWCPGRTESQDDENARLMAEMDAVRQSPPVEGYSYKIALEMRSKLPIGVDALQILRQAQTSALRTVLGGCRYDNCGIQITSTATETHEVSVSTSVRERPITTTPDRLG